MKYIRTFYRRIKQLIKKIRKGYYCFLMFSLLKNKRIIPLREDNKLLDSMWKKKKISCYFKSSKKTKNNFDLSIIVPLYNSARFVDKLIVCLVKQITGYKYEVIFVDDGSTDKTVEVIKEYQKNNMENADKIILIQQKNGGISSARNSGLDKADGKYISFLDHDDYVSEDFVEKMLSLAFESNADIVKCGTANIQNGVILNEMSRPNEVIDGSMGLEMINNPSFIWAGLYKYDLIKNVRFPESYWYEDMVVRFLLFRRAKKFVNTSDILHFRVQHANQASKTVWSNREYKCLEQLYLIEQLVEVNKKFGLDDDIYLYMNVLLECSTIMVKRIDKLDDDIKKQVFIRVKKLVSELFRDEYEQYLNGEWRLKSDVILKGRYDLWKMEKWL